MRAYNLNPFKCITQSNSNYKGDTTMRWQVLAGILAVGLLTVAPVSATVIDFSTDPNLATNWTEFPFYHEAFNPGGQLTATWNGTNQNLTLTSTTSEALDGLYRTGDTRSATDGVTVTYSNYTASPTPAVSADWTCAGLAVSASASPDLFAGSPSYAVYFQEDYTNGLRFSVNKAGLTQIGNSTLGSVPGTMKLDILRDGSAYVFKANGVEICRDTTYSSTSMPYYFMYWGGGAGDTLSVSADNYGTVVPEPGALALLATALLGLLCYAWRKRR